MKSPYEFFGIECARGWEGLYKPLIEKCQSMGGTVEQVKEKFGGLRFYFSPPSRYLTVKENKQWTAFHSAVNLAEEQSFKTCEGCGAEGSKHIHGGWIKTLCESCNAQWGNYLNNQNDVNPLGREPKTCR